MDLEIETIESTNHSYLESKKHVVSVRNMSGRMKFRRKEQR